MHVKQIDEDKLLFKPTTIPYQSPLAPELQACEL
jgi:hypothetical protein